MSDFITGSLCLSDIPKDKIRQADNGKKYLNICIASRREPDAYGNTHSIYVMQTKEERDSGEKRCYIGQGQERTQPRSVTPENVAAMPPAEEYDDLPW